MFLWCVCVWCKHFFYCSFHGWCEKHYKRMLITLTINISSLTFKREKTEKKKKLCCLTLVFIVFVVSWGRNIHVNCLHLFYDYFCNCKQSKWTFQQTSIKKTLPFATATRASLLRINVFWIVTQKYIFRMMMMMI